MALSLRTKKVLKGALADSATALEISNILDKVPAAGVPAVKASVTYETVDFEVTIAGAYGNTAALVFDGIKTIDTVVNAYNATAHPLAQVSYSGGLGTDVLAAGTAQLANGADEIPAVIAGGTLSARAKRILKWNFCDSSSYAEFSALIEAGSGSMSIRTKKIFKWVMCDNQAYLEISAKFA